MPARERGHTKKSEDSSFCGLADRKTTLPFFPPLGGEEMAFRAICVALLLSSLPSAGCGTVVNLVKPGSVGGGKIPFGGVRQDVSCIKTAAHGECDCRTPPTSESEQY